MEMHTDVDRPLVKIDGQTVYLIGSWTSLTLHRALAHLPRRLPFGEITVNCSGLDRLDTSGAWFISRSLRDLRQTGRSVSLIELHPDAQALLKLVDGQVDPRQVKAPSSRFTFLQRTGRVTIQLNYAVAEYLEFVGRIAQRWLMLVGRARWRLPQFFEIIEETGVNAVPIIALLSFLIGVVIAYQGLFVLRSYGAVLFAANLAGVSILRELGPLLAAIVVAGRTGSAFAAQIGTMRVSEEVDALVSMGLSPLEILVLPRVLGLIFTLPLLTVLADFSGILGATVTAQLVAGISPYAFLSQLGTAITPATALTGLAKTPVFAAVIATVGCFHGFQAESSAESVGRRTTRSVVQSIFFVIVIDAAFSVAYSVLNL